MAKYEIDQEIYYVLNSSISHLTDDLIRGAYSANFNDLILKGTIETIIQIKDEGKIKTFYTVKGWKFELDESQIITTKEERTEFLTLVQESIKQALLEKRENFENQIEEDFKNSMKELDKLNNQEFKLEK